MQPTSGLASRARASTPATSFGVACLLIPLLAACSGPGGATAQTSETPPVLATVAGEEITLEQLRGSIGSELDNMEVQYRRARSSIIERALDAAITERLLAAEAHARGSSVDELLAAEVPGGLAPTDVEIAMWYEDNRARLGGRSLDEVRGQIAQYLRQQRLEDARRRLDARLRSEHGVVVHYEPFRIPFDNDRAPSLGPASAPVTLVEFSDFQCPFCAQVVPTLKRVHETFGDQVRVVYRQFPITQIHPAAFKAAEASLCAHEQAKFWELHDAMFRQQSQLGVSELKQLARTLGLDGARFDTCLDSGRYVEQVQHDLREGQRAGVTGTPALFLNGRPLDAGAVPYDVLERAIRAELLRQNR